MTDEVLSQYIKDIYNLPRLEREEEIKLARRAFAGDQAAREKLIVSHLRFVVNIAKNYHCNGLDLTDLISEGNIGLLRAAETFDPERGIRFLSYAVWWIRQRIHRAVQHKAKLIRLPMHRNAELQQIEKFRSELRDVYGVEPEDHDIAAAMNISSDRIKQLVNIAAELASLDSEPLPGKESLVETVEAKESDSPDYNFVRKNLHDNINRMLDDLSPRESDILRCRFGLENRKPLSLRCLAERYQVTKERIRQIEKKAIKYLKQGNYWHYFDGFQLV